VEADIRTLLLTLSAVTDLVGTGDAARIRPDKLDQADDDSLQAIIVEVDSEEPALGLDGKGGRVYADVTLRCRARQKSQARAVADAVRTNGTDPGTGLAGYNGTVNGHTLDAWLEDTQTSFTPADDGSDEGFYDVFCSYRLTFEETT
jgi:hypothetical protein